MKASTTVKRKNSNSKRNQRNVAGATVWTGVDGFGKRRRSTIHLEGIKINMPLIIEIVDEQEKLEPLLSQIKRIVGDNGLVTLQDVDTN